MNEDLEEGIAVRKVVIRQNGAFFGLLALRNRALIAGDALLVPERRCREDAGEAKNSLARALDVETGAQ